MNATHAPIEVTPKLLREFGFVMAGGIALMFGLVIPWIADLGYPLWPWIASAAFVAAGLLVPRILRPLYAGWMKIGAALGWFNTRLILGLVFFLMFLPVRLIFELIRKDPMARRFQQDLKTYRVESKEAPRDHMEKPF